MRKCKQRRRQKYNNSCDRNAQRSDGDVKASSNDREVKRQSELVVASRQAAAT
ncbi:hypothetical protein PIB30_087181, partial [Stylosanthes scabra]|nr:hypothetical protein [Stylosanthes scabra]